MLLPMSITMISTSMLNAMGFEKQTFLFFFMGAAALLLCILLLPTFCGAYAYLIGLGVSYVVTAACNLVFLQKQKLLFQKGGVRDRNHALFISLFAMLPFAAFGQTCNNLFKLFLGEITAVAATAVVLSVLTLILYVALGFIPLKKLRWHGKRKPKKA